MVPGGKERSQDLKQAALPSPCRPPRGQRGYSSALQGTSSSRGLSVLLRRSTVGSGALPRLFQQASDKRVCSPRGWPRCGRPGAHRDPRSGSTPSPRDAPGPARHHGHPCCLQSRRLGAEQKEKPGLFFFFSGFLQFYFQVIHLLSEKNKANW